MIALEFIKNMIHLRNETKTPFKCLTQKNVYFNQKKKNIKKKKIKIIKSEFSI